MSLDKQCSLCEKTALYHVGSSGYCRDHMDTAVAMLKREKREKDAHHGVTSYQYASERRDRGRA